MQVNAHKHVEAPAFNHFCEENIMSVTMLSTLGTGALKVTGGLYLADLLTGAFHWFEDRYGNPKWPVLGHTIRQNQQHHHTPRSFLGGTFVSRNKDCLLYTSPSPRDS